MGGRSGGSSRGFVGGLRRAGKGGGTCKEGVLLPLEMELASLDGDETTFSCGRELACRGGCRGGCLGGCRGGGDKTVARVGRIPSSAVGSLSLESSVSNVSDAQLFVEAFLLCDSKFPSKDV